MGIDWNTIAPYDAALVRAEVEVAEAEIAGDADRIRNAVMARSVAQSKRDFVMSQEWTTWLNGIMPSTVRPRSAG